MVALRLRRRPIIETTLGQRLVLWLRCEHVTLTYCCFNAVPASLTVAQH